MRNNNNNNNNNSGRGGWRGNNNNGRYNNNNNTNNNSRNTSGGSNPFATNTTTTTTTSQQQSSAGGFQSRGANNFNRQTNNAPSSSNPFSRQQQTPNNNNSQQHQQSQPQPQSNFGNNSNAASRNPFASSGSASVPTNQRPSVMMTTHSTNHTPIGSVFNQGALGGTVNSQVSGNTSGFNSQPFSGGLGYPMASSSNQANRGNNPFALSGGSNPPPSNAFGSAFGTNTTGSSSGGFGSHAAPAPISAEMRSALKSLDLKDALEGQANSDDAALADMLPTSGEGNESQSSLPTASNNTATVQGGNGEEVIKKHHDAISQFEKWLESSHPVLSQAVKPMRDEVAKVKPFDLIAKNNSQWHFVAGRLPSCVPSN
eukprot:scaffold212_cov174-Ochromonas_danica.AAC.5